MRMKNLKKMKKNSDNRGFSFVLVIIAIGVVSLLIAVVLWIAYQNYQMKVTGLKSEDNFYSAEQVLDEIKAGLQGDMSSSVSEAYSYVMEHYTETDGQDGVRNWYFQTQYVDNLYEKLLKPGTDGEYDLAYLSNYVIQGSPEEAAALPDALSDEDEVSGGITVQYKDGSKVELLCAIADEPASLADEGPLVTGEKPLQFNYKKGVTINGLIVKYTNARGYLSVVSTDLVLEIPAINFTQTETSPDLLSYAVIAEGGVSLKNNLGGRSTIDGNLYAGSINIENANLTVKARDYLIAKDGVNVKANSTTNSNLAKDQYHFVHEGGSLWTDSFTVDGATLRLNGDVYVRDDLTLNGKGSVASIAGRYLGYSNPKLLNDVTNEAAASSAILVNGRDSVIDLMDLKDLLLAGNGYINLGGAVADTSTQSGYFRENDDNTIRMGESIAIKSNQLAYFAPASAIRVSNGTIVESGNPVTVKLDAGKKLSDLSIYLNTQVVLRELNGMSLSQLGIDANECQKYIVQKENTDDTLTIYVYMKLDEAKAANYFDAYYGTEMEKYAKIFLPSVAEADEFQDVFNKSLSEVERFDINGNIAGVADHNLNKEEVRQEVLGYQNAFKALSKKLILSYSVLTDEEKKEDSTVFSNLVNKAELNNFVTIKGGNAVFSTPVTDMKAILVNGDYTVTSADSDVRLIVATGDVVVKADFKGLIICEGKVVIEQGANITAVPEETAAVFQCIYGEDKNEVEYKNETVSPMSFFKEGEQYLLNGIASGYISGSLGEQINLTDFIKFENWKKQ